MEFVRGIASLLGGGAPSGERTQTASMTNPVNHQSSQNQSNPQINHVHYAPNYVTQMSPTQVNPAMVGMQTLPTAAPPVGVAAAPAAAPTAPPVASPSVPLAAPGPISFPIDYGQHLGQPLPGQGVYPGQVGQSGYPMHTMPGLYNVLPEHMRNFFGPVPQPVVAVPPAQPSPSSKPKPVVDWVLSTPRKAIELQDRAVVGGYDIDGCDLWVIRTRFESELLPAKLNIGTKCAFIPWRDQEKRTYVFEVCCAPKSKIQWIGSSDGDVPPNAVEGGHALDGETLYIGRATHGRSLCPGKIHPSRGCLYVSYAFKSHAHSRYEVLCIVP